MNKKFIIGFILGIILSGSVVYASVFYGRDVSYDNTNSHLVDENNNNINNVQDAIDELYNMINEHNNYTLDDIILKTQTSSSTNGVQTNTFSTGSNKIPTAGKIIVTNPNGSHLWIDGNGAVGVDVENIVTDNATYFYADLTNFQSSTFTIDFYHSRVNVHQAINIIYALV